MNREALGSGVMSTGFAMTIAVVVGSKREDGVATIFGKVISREIPATIVYEDELCLAFTDINPQAPTHVLLVPKKEIPRLTDATAEDEALLGHMMLAAAKVARQLGVGDAFRLVINNGADAGQSVFHLHMHILGGRGMAWPPG